jgi:hypothetical protein
MVASGGSESVVAMSVSVVDWSSDVLLSSRSPGTFVVMDPEMFLSL